MISKPEKDKTKAKEKEKEKHELIIIRRLEEEEHESHNTAWKVAHADFMTAMMAFFLIMWLINVTDDETRKGISAYFNPVHLSAAQKGLEDEARPAKNTKGKPSSIATSKPGPDKSGEAKGAGGQAGKDGSTKTGADAQGEQREAATKGAGAAGAEGKSASAAGDKARKDVVGLGTTGGGMAGLTNPAELTDAEICEQAAFHDPYSVLAQLAAAYSATRPADSDAVVGDDRLAGLASGPSERDPFDPVYWQTTPSKPYKTDHPGATGKTPRIPAGSFDAAAAAAVQAPVEQAPIPAPRTPPATADELAEKKTVDATKAAPDKVIPDPIAVTRQAARLLDGELRQALAPDLAGSPAPRVKVEATDDGVLISLTDDANFSMFDIGSAIPNGKVVFILDRIADMLAKRGGPIIIRGFTDGRPFRSNIYDNWRLSVERAHMAYYMLLRGGLDEIRVSKIEGYADHSLKNPKDPNAAENRRIEILLERPTS